MSYITDKSLKNIVNTDFLSQRMHCPVWAYRLITLIPLLSWITAIQKCCYLAKAINRGMLIYKIFFEFIGFGFVELIIAGIGALLRSQAASSKDAPSIQSANGSSSSNVDPLPYENELKEFERLFYLSKYPSDDSNLGCWIKNHFDLFDEDFFKSLSFERQSLFAVILTEENVGDSSKKETIIAYLPKELQDFNDLSISQIWERFKKNEERAITALAAAINNGEWIEELIVVWGSLKKNQKRWERLAPRVFNANLTNVQLPNNELTALLKLFSNAKMIVLSSTKIEVIPELLACEELLCDDCQSLKSILGLPRCENLKIINCNLLESFPETLPACKKFCCNHCEKLESLPENLLPVCIDFECMGWDEVWDNNRLSGYSNKLKSLPKTLPECEKFCCCKFTKLTSLPSLPQCKDVDCSECPSLKSIEVSRTWEKLDCSYCTGLLSRPTLPQGAEIIDTGCQWNPL